MFIHVFIDIGIKVEEIRITYQPMSKIDMKHVTFFSKHDIVIMSVY